MDMKSLINRSDFELTKDTPYLALTGELWSVFCQYYGEGGRTKITKQHQEKCCFLSNLRQLPLSFDNHTENDIVTKLLCAILKADKAFD